MVFVFQEMFFKVFLCLIRFVDQVGFCMEKEKGLAV
tara:strand:- start:215 stop:322 length:108 start_codon:yes stop_codon:yes gene_type:complete